MNTTIAISRKKSSYATWFSNILSYVRPKENYTVNYHLLGLFAISAMCAVKNITMRFMISLQVITDQITPIEVYLGLGAISICFFISLFAVVWYLFRNKWAVFGCILFSSIYYYVTFLVYEGNNNIITPTLLRQINEGLAYANASFSFFSIKHFLIAFADIPVIYFILKKMDFKKLPTIKTRDKVVWMSTFAFMVIMFHAIAIVKWVRSEVPIMISQIYGFCPAILADTITFVKNDVRPLPHKAEDERDILKENGLNVVIKGRNIMMLQLESIGANIIGQKVNGTAVMPFLTSLAQKHIYFPRFITLHKAGSADAEFCALNGLRPPVSGNVFSSASYDFPNALSKKLKDHYSFHAFHGNIGGFFDRDVAYKRMDFDQFYDAKALTGENRFVDDRNFFKMVFDIIHNNDDNAEKKRRYDYLISLTSHTPFKFVPENQINVKFENTGSPYTDRMYTSFSYLDKEASKFFQKIDLENTVLFIFGDHTPPIPSKHADLYKRAKFDGVEYVPLLVVTPEGLQKRIETKYNNVNLYYTIFNRFL